MEENVPSSDRNSTTKVGDLIIILVDGHDFVMVCWTLSNRLINQSINDFVVAGCPWEKCDLNFPWGASLLTVGTQNVPVLIEVNCKALITINC